MINVKQIAKPKSGSASSGGGASGVVVKTTEEAKYAAKAGSAEYAEQAKYADSAGYSSRAAYADSAGDIADGSPVYDKFLRKDIADTASGLVTLNKGLALGNTGYGVDGSGNATLNRVSVNDKVTTPDFVDGLAGEGFRLWKEKGLTYLTLDKLTVRQTMSVFEMLINKIRSVGGQICVSAANGKIKSVTYSSGYYFITFEDENQFQLGDLVRCQTFTGGTAKSYWVTVASVLTLTEGGQAIGVNESDFNGAVPEVGDECVLMGNTDNLNRQSLVLISAAEDGKPRVDVLNGVKSTDAVNTLRARLGKLDGIESSSFPEDNQPSGDGLYADNAYLKGTFILSATGEDVATRFTITENGIKSKVESVRSDFQAEGNYLDNPAFLSGLDKWNYGTAATAFTTGNSYIWANDNVLTHDGEIDVVEDGERQTVKMKNMYLTQLNADMKNKPDTTADGKAVGVTLSFRYKCTAAGTLSAHLTSSDASVLGVIQELAVTDGYETFTVTGLWYGTEDLTIAFSGEIYIAMISLRPDSGKTLASKYSTLFAQSDKLVNIAAANYDDNGGVLEKSEIMTTSKYNTLISEKFDSDGRLKNTAGLVTTTDAESFVTTTEAQNTLKNYMKTASFSGMFAAAVDENNIVKKADISAFVSKDSDGNLESGVKVTADNIVIDGVASFNNNFIVNTDGCIEAVNGKFSGEITASSGTIAGLKISEHQLTNDNASTTALVKFSSSTHISQIGRYVETDGTSPIFGSLSSACFGAWEVDSKNIAIIANATAGQFNYALLGKGDVVVQGSVIGSKLAVFEPSDTNGYRISLYLLKSTTVLVKTSKSVTLYLPTESDVRSYLSLGGTDTFAVTITVINASSYWNIAVKDSESTLSAGEAMRWLLTYDGTKYKAYKIS